MERLGRRLERMAAAVAAVALSLSSTVLGEQPESPAGATTPPPAKAPLGTVTVEAQRERKEVEREVSHFVSAVPVHYLHDPFARWNTPICPLVAGLPREQGEFVLARLSQIASSAKAPLGGEHCQANFYVVVTQQPEILIKSGGRTTLARSTPPMVGDTGGSFAILPARCASGTTPSWAPPRAGRSSSPTQAVSS